MSRKLIEDLHQHFEQIENPTNTEQHFLRELTEAIEYFPIIRLHRDDLISRGFNGEEVDDCDMITIAEKLKTDYCEQLHWQSLDIIATDMEVPKIRYSICPKCEKQIDSRKSCCGHCGETWSENIYVLVEFPEDSSYFEQEEIGYPCFNTQDNGARYVSEYEYILHFGKNPNSNKYFKPIQWPDSQRYFELKEESKSIFNLCESIESDEKALENFGYQAVWVPLCVIKGKK